ncbi:beta-1,6-N-acetylglucosaminyltransferase [Pontibacter sp. H249]|uniref:beta-1,6-N-acetylglucosaminyltransferase n=1 Tax=Pontibacter sp. H249 TaxID=3133420 RepID=UPI0030C4DE3B
MYLGRLFVGRCYTKLYAEIIADNKCNYTILLSEKCYPIVDNDALNNYLKKNYQYEHIDIFPVAEVWKNWRARVYNYKINLSSKKGDYMVLPYIFGSSIKSALKKIGALAIKSCQRKNFRIVLEVRKIFKKREPSLIAHYGGSLWWGLTYNTLRQVVEFTHNNNRYVTFHQDTLVPDEIFFHSIIKHLALTDKKIKVKPSLTYVTWSSKQEPHPITFTSNNLEELISQRANNKMFARKFDAEYCEEILDLLDNNIMHNSSPNPLRNQVLVEQKPA